MPRKNERVCPCCHQLIKAEKLVDPLKLKALRGMLAQRLAPELVRGKVKPLSQRRMGHILGISESTYRNYETGKTAVPPAVAYKVQQIWSGKKIFRGENEPTPEQLERYTRQQLRDIERQKRLAAITDPNIPPPEKP